MYCNMKLAKFALTSPLVAISVALFAALSSFAGDATMAKAAGVVRRIHLGRGCAAEWGGCDVDLG